MYALGMTVRDSQVLDAGADHLKSRGVKDVFVICTDGLKGSPEAIEALFPNLLVQTCIVHLIRSSLNFVNWKERKSIAADLKSIYRASSAERAEAALAEFRRKYPKHQVVPMSGSGVGCG